MLSRRDLVGKLAAGTAAVCAVGVARTSLASPSRSEADSSKVGTDAAGNEQVAERAAAPQSVIIDAEAPLTLSAEQPWELLHPLSAGQSVGHGWHVAGLTGATSGSVVVTLQNERGRTHRVHVCRNNGNPQGLVYTKHFDMLVMNGGAGDMPTEEGLAQAVAELAHVLAANEDSRRHATTVTALLAHDERVQRFSGAEDRRLR